MTRPLDTKTVARFAAGEEQAVREVYRAFSRPVFTVAMGALGDRSLAEEAVQQTFLQAWRAAARVDPERDLGPWLYAIARRVAVDLYRRERRHQRTDTEEPEIAVIPESFEGTWRAWEVRAALDQMPVEERDVVRAVHFHGLTHDETAEALGIPVGTVKSRSHRAHRRLADLLAHLEEATG
jgi:RNA polymerase sigma-70 factor, ECF subfamily